MKLLTTFRKANTHTLAWLLCSVGVWIAGNVLYFSDHRHAFTPATTVTRILAGPARMDRAEGQSNAAPHYYLGPCIIGTDESPDQLCTNVDVANTWAEAMTLTVSDRTCSCESFALSQPSIRPGNSARLDFCPQLTSGAGGGRSESFISFRTGFSSRLPQTLTVRFTVESYPRFATTWTPIGPVSVGLDGPYSRQYTVIRHLCRDEQDPGPVVVRCGESGRLRVQKIHNDISWPHPEVRRVTDTYVVQISPRRVADPQAGHEVVAHQWGGGVVSIQCVWHDVAWKDAVTKEATQ